tara:strand:+ start:650 stop:1192 length:543 start_codon:yes stop_codon:yes gene_type:complete
MHFEIIDKKKKQIRLGMRAIMFRELSPRELQIYRTGFKNGYRMAEAHLVFKSQQLADRMKMKDDREQIKKKVDDKHPVGYETFSNIVRVVANHFCISPQEVYSRRRLAYIVKPRSVIINYCLEHFNISTPKLGMFFNFDHSTVIHHRRQKVKQVGIWKPLELVWQDYEKIKKELVKSLRS